MEGAAEGKRPTSDPVLVLHAPGSGHTPASSSAHKRVGNSVTSLVFLTPSTTDAETSAGQHLFDDDEDDMEDFTFQTQRLLQPRRGRPLSSSDAAVALSLTGRFLASCHGNGDVVLWDLGQRQGRHQTLVSQRGPGLALRRLSDSSSSTTGHFLYQTRDEAGTVSLYDVEHSTGSPSGGDSQAPTLRAVAQYETYSRSFCAAVPCLGNSHLVALPSAQLSTAVVRDWRVPTQGPPLATIDLAAGTAGDPSSSGALGPYGMLTSLALSQDAHLGQILLATGMESGHVLLHDLRHLGNRPCSVALGRDPILSLDLSPSPVRQPNQTELSWVLLAGMAGDAADLAEMDPADRGTVALIKATWTERTSAFQARLRTRLATCDLESPRAAGKPGVSIGRFRPDGRILAVGGWDKRIRIFDRGELGRPLAILRGHEGSVNALDWASDAQKSGFLATGAEDGLIYIWKCFGSGTLIPH